ncbi:MAG: tetratricopeptide repeat protein [Deltaproteobacteria bacterium]|nr:MAG: tetratricopeptide repeat protein [Deltaproteobacteria bacterium]
MAFINLEPETHLTLCRKNVFAVVAILVIVLAIYSNTFHASWQFDDEINILTNKPLHLKELNWSNIKKTFFASLDGGKKIYRPTACLSFALNYFFGEDDVFGYHVVNISIHLLAAVFLFLLIYNILNLPILRARYGPNSYSIALLATVLWAINPVQIQAVTYIVQRMASMAGLFYIVSMYFYLKGRTSEHRILQPLYFLLCFSAAALAFGSKENAAMLPISIFLFDLFLIQGLTRKNIKRNLVIFLALFLIPLVLALILRGPSLFSGKNLVSSYGHRAFTLGARLLTEPRIILFYISLLFYPMPDRLCITHDIAISHNFIDPPTTIVSILIILGILCLSILKSRQWPFVSYCIIFFFINHLIESSVFPLELVFEHRNYIPSMLFFAPVAILLLRALQLFSNKRSMQATISIFIILVLVGQGHSTFVRNVIWKTEESLWMDAVDKNPNLPRPYHNLAKYYGDMGNREKAMTLYHKALTLKRGPNRPSHHMTHYNLALEYISLDQKEKALEHLRKAIELAPGFSGAYNNLGVLMMEQGKYDEAFDNFTRALSYDENSTIAHNNLAVVLLKRGRLEDALIESRKALALQKDSPRAFHNLGIIYKYKKQFSKAKHYLALALKKRGKDIMTRLHMIEVLYQMQDKVLLTEFLAETLRIIPPEKLHALITKIAADNIPTDEAPDLQIVLPLLGRAYLERSDMLRKYGSRYLEKGKANEDL